VLKDPRELTLFWVWSWKSGSTGEPIEQSTSSRT